MKEKILIIEDDPLIRNELKTLLQSNGYETVAPENFSDVIAATLDFAGHQTAGDQWLFSLHRDSHIFRSANHLCDKLQHGYGRAE